MFFVIVESTVQVDIANTEELLEHVQALNALGALRDCKLMAHLEASFVASAVCPLRLPDEVDRKTSFSINKTGYPADSDQSFLLIVRIRRIVTARFANTTKCLSAERVPRNTRIFQHIAKFY